MQEQLHIDQAVEDIVRIIKQDLRASLLIVQLLRRYQLEKSECFETTKTMPTNQRMENKPQEIIQDTLKIYKKDGKNYSDNCCSNYDCDYNSSLNNYRKNVIKQNCDEKKSKCETPLVIIDDSNDESSSNLAISQEEMIQNSVKTIFKSAKARKKINKQQQNK